MHAAALLSVLAAALLLPGCAAPSPTAPRAAQPLALASTSADVLPGVPPSVPELPVWHHPCPLPPRPEHVVQPAREVWRQAGCFVAQEPVLTGLTVGETRMDFNVPEHAQRLHAVLHMDGHFEVDAALALGKDVFAHATGRDTVDDTVVVLDVPHPVAGQWTLRLDLDPLRPVQGWWAAVQADLAP